MEPTLIAVRCRESAAAAGDADAALAQIDREGGVWLGCDVQAPGLYAREAKVAVDTLLSFQLDGRRLRVLPHGGIGRALAQRLRPLAAFEDVDGRLECDFDDVATSPHPVVGLLRRFLAGFAPTRGEFGLYGALAFDYYRLAGPEPLPADGRRRLALCLPARVLVSGDSGHRWLDFDFPSLTPVAGAPAHFDMLQPSGCEDDLPSGGHARAVAQGVEQLRAGALCSLVLSQTFRRRVEPVDAPAAFCRLRRDNPYPAMFFAHLGGGERVFGASPDIQVRADAAWVETAPVCGTFSRGADPVDDHEQAKAFVDSAVDEAALALCADSDRNDKALVCEPGSVELLSRRRLHFFATIMHTIDHVRGRRRAGVDAFDIVLAHATPATVSGMPKAAARELIERIEGSWRGWYAGAMVRLGADGSCEALTMLRFARLLGDVAEVRSGGNLLADSDPPREEEETRLKAQTLFRVLAGQSPRAPLATPPPPSTPVRAHLRPGGDALAALEREALVQAGCVIDPAAAIDVFGDGPLPSLRETLPSPHGRATLALNNAALVLLERDGAPLQRLEVPQFGRALRCHADADGILAALGDFSVSAHAAHGVWQLPLGWQPAARAADGRIAAAVHPQRRIVALIFRPDMLHSLRHAAGQRALQAALRWLHERVA